MQNMVSDGVCCVQNMVRLCVCVCVQNMVRDCVCAEDGEIVCVCVCVVGQGDRQKEQEAVKGIFLLKQ